MTYEQFLQDVRERRAKCESYQTIGERYNLNKAVVWKLCHGEKVSKKTLAHLHLEPSAKLKATRERREKLDAIARSWKYSSWANYETVCIREMEADNISYDHEYRLSL